MSEVCYVSLGSNLGGREDNLAAAISALGEYAEITDLHSASFYATQPLYKTDQPEFLNTVIEFKTSAAPEELIRKTQHVEALLGRPEKRKKNQPRIIDLDILCMGNKIVKTKRLILPHPDLPNRRFVLVPFHELAPYFEVPLWNVTVKTLLANCQDQSRIRKHILQKNA